MNGSIETPGTGWFEQALEHGAMGRHAEALALFEGAIAAGGADRDTWYNRGVALGKLGRPLDALISYDKAVALDGAFGPGWRSHGNALVALKCYSEALVSYARAAECHPKPEGVAGALAYARTMLCNWEGLDAAYREIAEGIRCGEHVTHVGGILASPLDADLHRRCAEIAVSSRHHGRGERPAPHGGYPGRRIRIGYVSGDFRNHPVGYQALALLREHDRRGYEVHVYSLHSAESDACQEEIRRAADAFHDLGVLDNASAVSLVRSHALDVAVDLQGHTVHSRMALFAQYLAPLQVNYLCPGTSGAPFLDYILADEVAIPPEHHGAFVERIVTLPGSFFIADYSAIPRAACPSRESEGLPPRGTVFACFSDSYKITPDIFEAWMRLLQRVEGSVLWLGQRSTPASGDALRRKAAVHGVSPDRLVMARYANTRTEHLARLSLADLCLDTRHYNGHTTVVDALWAGVPVVTVPGAAFCGRVAASILCASGLRDFVARDMDEYVALAHRLATDEDWRAAVRLRITRSRGSVALFDTPGTVRNVERAYRHMLERAWRGEPPESFVVDPQGADPKGDVAR